MVFCCKITIGNLIFPALTEVEILHSWKVFTDSAIIKIPKAVHFREGNKLRPVKNVIDLFKIGEPVKIELGYNRQLITEFTGYIAYNPVLGFPIEIKCEDEMWQLKRKKVSVSIPDATIKQIVQAAAPGYEVDCINEFYGDFSLLNTTPLQVFEKLRKTVGVNTFFRGNKLVCGKEHTDTDLPDVTANYKVGVNIIENDLSFQSNDSLNVTVKATSKQPDGSVIYLEIGEPGGRLEELNVYNQSEKELKESAQRFYENTKDKEGFIGSLTSFGFPYVQHGQRIRIVDDLFEKRDTTHFAGDIRVTASPSEGYRRTVEVGRKTN